MSSKKSPGTPSFRPGGGGTAISLHHPDQGSNRGGERGQARKGKDRSGIPIYRCVAVVREDEEKESDEVKQRLIAGIEIKHRGRQIKEVLVKRAGYRKRRRSANTRYRKPRFDNRTRPEGWLPPSLKHRVDTTISWVQRLSSIAPVQGISVESVRFDTQKLQNPEISGAEYQQGELLGYEVREYLLEKWGRQCAYCGARNVPLEIEHLVPKSRGGSNRVSNLTLSCRKCNQKKGSKTAEEFLKDKPQILEKIQRNVQRSLRDAAAVNATRNALVGELSSFGLPVETASGGRTKYNRMRLGISKSQIFDALCVGKVDTVSIETESALCVKCSGRGQYARTLPDKYGFPRVHLPRTKSFFGFATGDMVRANVPKGKYQETYTGRVTIRKTGCFGLKRSEGKQIDVNAKYCVMFATRRWIRLRIPQNLKPPPFTSPLVEVGEPWRDDVGSFPRTYPLLSLRIGALRETLSGRRLTPE